MATPGMAIPRVAVPGLPRSSPTNSRPVRHGKCHFRLKIAIIAAIDTSLLGRSRCVRQRWSGVSRNARYISRVAPLLFLDMLLAAGCFLTAYAIRFDTPLESPGVFIEALRGDRWFQQYIVIIIAAPFIRAFTYNLFGIYDDSTLNRSAATNLLDICKAVTTGSVVIVVIAFMYRSVAAFPEFGYSRRIFLMDWLLNLVCVAGLHACIAAVRNELLRRGIGYRRIAVQGAGLAAQSLLRELDEFPDKRYRVAGFIANDVPDDAPVLERNAFLHLGETSDILDIINQHNLDEVVVTNAGSLGSGLMTFVEECHKRNVLVKLSLDFYGILTQGRKIEEMGGQPVIQVNEIAIEGFARILKRIEDIIVSILLLIITFPLWIVLALLIKGESPGPILFLQKRVGKHGRTFKMYKFRSMYRDAEDQKEYLDGDNEAEGLIFKMRDDPRVTRIGRVLRRMCLDEIPQFLNVLRGEMSIVGPRPPLPDEVAQYNDQDMMRLVATPGITGLWQVNRGHRYSFEEVINWDTYYIENWSLWLDIKIMLKTVWVILSGRGF